MPPRKPNILLIVLESTRASHLSCYGYSRQTTPNLDRLAEEGVLYEHAISVAPWTLPSHASLFTGLHTSQHGATFDHPRLGDQFLTLATVLRQHGYHTAAFSTNPWVDKPLGFDQGFETFRMAKRSMEWLAPLFPNETFPEKVFRAVLDPWYPASRQNNRLMKKWIESVRNGDRPFFAYTLYFDPHYPLRPRQPYAAEFLGPAYRRWWRINKDPDRYMAGAARISDDDFEILKGLYDSRIASMDDTIGSFLEFLRHSGLLDNTLVFVIADHGENLGEHGLMSHQYSLHETLIHVPLIIRYPERFTPGRRFSGLVQSTEIFTTVLDVLGIDRNDLATEARGRSLVPEMLSEQALPYVISEYLAPNLERMRRLYSGTDLSRYDRTLRAIRTETHKLIWASDGRHELYDLATDPGEESNLIDDRPELLTELSAQMQDWSQAIQVSEVAESTHEMEEVVVARLRDLGYL